MKDLLKQFSKYQAVYQSLETGQVFRNTIDERDIPVFVETMLREHRLLVLKMEGYNEN